MRYQNKAENLTLDIKIINNHQNDLLINNDNNRGLIIARKALEHSIRLPKEKGISAVAVKNSSHFDAENYYDRKYTENNLIELIMTNTAPLMALYSGNTRN